MERRRRRHEDGPPKGPQRAADLVAQLMARRGYGRVQAAAVDEAAWTAAAGERFAPHTRPGPLRRGTLEVLVRNSAVLQELTFEKKKVLKKLTALLPDGQISDLKLRIGHVG